MFSVGELDFNGTQFDLPTFESGVESVTSTDTSDEYVFNFDSITGPSRVKAVVWGMTANVNLSLIGPAPGSTVIATSILPGTASDSVFSNELVPGEYTVRVTRGDNNPTAEYRILITIEPGSDGSTSNATDLGLLFPAITPTVRASGTVGSKTDLVDHYGVQVSTAGPLRINLSGMTTNLEVRLLNNAGQVVFTAPRALTQIENLLTPRLAAGQYYLRVVPANPIEIPGSDPGDFPTSPYVLEATVCTSSDDVIASGTQTFLRDNISVLSRVSGNVGGFDNIHNYHKLSLNNHSSSTAPQRDVRLTLSGMTNDLDVQVLNGDGVALQTGTAVGAGFENVLLTGLARGDYYVRVFPKVTDPETGPLESNYDLTLSLQPTSDDLITNAGSLGTLSMANPTLLALGSLGFVSSAPADPQDYHRITLDTRSDVALNLTGGHDLDVELLSSTGRVIRSGIGTGIEMVGVPRLAAGEYFLRVFPKTLIGGLSSKYELAVTRTITSDDLVLNAPDLTSVATGTVGSTTDLLDHYQFSVDQAYENVLVTLNNLTANLTVQILNGQGALMQSGTVPGTGSEQLRIGLTEGDYFVRVMKPQSESPGTANYRVQLQRLGSPLVLGSLSTATPSLNVSGIGDLRDGVQDFHEFSLAAPGTVHMAMSGMYSDLDFELLTSTGTLIFTPRSSGVTIESATFPDLAAGTYRVRVMGSADAPSSDYNLSIGLGTTDDLITTPNVLPALSASVPTARVINSAGGADLQDFHRLDLSATSNVRANLSGMTDSLNLQILDSFGRSVGGSSASGTAMESVNHTALAAGTYFVRVYRRGSAATSTYDLNVTIQSSGDDVPSTATDRGTLVLATNPTFIVSDTVGGSSDLQDYQRFSLAAPSAVRLNLSKMTADLNVEILNSAGVIVASGVAAGNAIENVLAAVLPAGSYLTRVFSASAASSAYDLTVSVATTSDDLLTNAINLGSLSSTHPTVLNRTSVGGANDIHDYFRVSLAAASTLRVNLSGIQSSAANHSVQVLNSFGVVIGSSSNAGTAIEDVVLSSLASGVYYIRVIGSAGVSQYDLGVSIATSPDDLIKNAANLGTLSAGTPVVQTFQSVGDAADIHDYYKVTLSATSDIRLALSNLSGNLDVRLMNADGVIIGAGLNSGNAIESILVTARPAGDYFIRVSPATVGTNCLYELAVTNAPTSDDLITNATSLGALSATLPTVQVAGSVNSSSDKTDYYQFTLATASNVRVNLSGMSGDADVFLEDRFGRSIAGGTLGSNSIENLIGNALAAGTYYVRIVAFAPSTNYVLTTSISDTSDDLLSNTTVLGTLNSSTLPTIRTTGVAGGSNDLQDYHRFDLATAATVRLNLSNMTTDLDVQILDQFGQVVAFGAQSGNTIERVTTPSLAVGKYFIRVFQLIAGVSSNYTLEVTTDFNGDDLIRGGQNLGTLASSTLTGGGAVGGAADIQDYYRFTLSSTRNVRFLLSGLSADIDVQIFNSFGNLVGSGTSGSTSTEDFTLTGLLVGVYYIRIFPFGAVTSNYSLSVSGV